MDKNKQSPASRRSVLQAGFGILAAGAVAGVAHRAAAQEKIAQNLVQYQDHPNNGQQCSSCANFVAPNTCKVVAGTISPNGWCGAFAPKG